ncbi:MAG: hypothetical protein NTV52_36820 [Acidobacteria bacterium]|nr:hypothetical protein [Acidobacteriota bacterium]
MRQLRHGLGVTLCVCSLAWALPAAVGEGAANAPEDVTLLQAMLRVVKGPGGRPYVSFRMDGELGAGTKLALAAFQRDNKIVESPVKPEGPTWTALRAALPGAYAGLRVLPGSRIVYFEATAAEAAKSIYEIESYGEFETGFQKQIVEMVRRMYEEHRIVLWITLTGWRRAFGTQATISRRASWAGPGESTHHYGRACDLGFRDFRWMDAGGMVRTDTDWLEKMSRELGPASWKMWKARDTIAFSLGLFKIAWEGVHLQAVEDERVNNARSLVKLLEKTGGMKWEVETKGRVAHYRCDLGRGKGMVPVGTAQEIWTGRALVGDAAMRKALREEFEKAERNWRAWEAVE